MQARVAARLCEACLAATAEGRIFKPVEHEQSPIELADLLEGDGELVRWRYRHRLRRGKALHREGAFVFIFGRRPLTSIREYVDTQALARAAGVGRVRTGVAPSPKSRTMPALRRQGTSSPR